MREEQRKIMKMLIIENHLKKLLEGTKEAINVVGKPIQVLLIVNKEIKESTKYIFNEEITVEQEETEEGIKFDYHCMGEKIVGLEISKNPNYKNREEMGEFLDALKDILNDDDNDIVDKIEKIKNITR